jgi:hypothetical protein
VSEDSGAVPAPYVLDVRVLTAITRGDYGIMTFIQQLDASGQPLVISVLAMTGAVLDLRSDAGQVERSTTIVTGTTPAAKPETHLRLSWWIRAPRWIRGNPVHRIRHQARIHHRMRE